MKKIKSLLLFSGIIGAVAVILRLIQLLSINDQGVVTPMWLSLPVYAAIALIFVSSFTAVKKTDFDKAQHRVTSGIVAFALPIFGFALMLEAVAAFLAGLWDTADIAAYLAAFVAGAGITACFALRCFGNKKTKNLSTLSYVALLVFLVLETIDVFVGNSTALAFTANLFTLVILCAELFFFKALAKEIENCGSNASGASLTRSALMLVMLIPAEIASQLCYLFSLESVLTAEPVRGGVLELFTAVAVFAVALCVLLSIKSKPVCDTPCDEESGEDISPSEMLPASEDISK